MASEEVSFWHLGVDYYSALIQSGGVMNNIYKEPILYKSVR